jgi:hypothetical protein
MSIPRIEKISKTLGEPEWVFSWREERLKLVETLPKTLKYGIGIAGVLPQNTEGDPLVLGEGYPLCFEKTADYHVDASKGLELYTWKEAVGQEEIVPILEGLMKSEFFPQASNYYAGLAQALFRSGLVVYAQPSVGDNGVSKEDFKKPGKEENFDHLWSASGRQDNTGQRFFK